jgi:O-6-methylguanine DNA methyltransferase
MVMDTQQAWAIFPVANAFCGIAWCERGVTHFLLPETTIARMQKELQLVTAQREPAQKMPAWIARLIRQIAVHLKGKSQDFSAIPVFIEKASPFMHAVYDAARRIPAGEVVSYAELARRIKKPGAVRAVGTALGKNPVPLIIPCHRIIAASGKLGGFSAQGGLDAKKMLLHCEGVSVEKPQLMASAAQWQSGVRFLLQDKQFRQLHKQVGEFAFQPQHNAEPLDVFIQAIVSQQLSTKVATTIFERVNQLVSKRGKPCAKTLLSLPDATLRGAGLSGMKVAYLKDLAQHALRGELPSLAEAKAMSDEQLVRCFTAIKGIGRWSVEMYLIFDLGRADIFPVDDYGIRKAIMQLHNLAELPPAKAMAQYGEAWKPYRSIASLYLWRLLDNA